MRGLVIMRILDNFRKGLNETGLGAIHYSRKHTTGEGIFPEGISYEEELSLKDLAIILVDLTDKELLQVLDEQACQRYR